MAKGLTLRHDHGSQFIADDFQNEIKFLGIKDSASYVREPKGNGIAERFVRILKENLLWIRSFNTVEELRLALLAFKEVYNQQWRIGRHGYRSPDQVREQQRRLRSQRPPNFRGQIVQENLDRYTLWSRRWVEWITTSGTRETSKPKMEVEEMNSQLFSFNSIDPFQSLPQMAAKYVSELADELKVDRNIVACAVLSTVMAAHLTQLHCIVDEDYVIPGSLWMLVGAYSGAGKTPVYQRVQSILEELILEKVCLASDHVRSIESRRDVLGQKLKILKRKAARASGDKQEALIEQINLIQEELESLTLPASPLIDKINMYAFSKELSKRNGVMAAIGAEGAFLPALSMVSPDLLHPLLKSWSNEAIHESSKRYGDVIVRNPSISMAVAWQTQECQKFLTNPKYLGIGLTARFLYYEAPINIMRIGSGNYLTKDSKDWWRQVLSRVMDVHLKNKFSKVVHLFLSEEARSCFKSYRFEYFPFYHDIDCPQGLMEKKESQAVRLAIALHCLEHDLSDVNTISYLTMKNACFLTNYFLNQSVQVVKRVKSSKVRKLAFLLCQEMSRFQSVAIGPIAFFPTKQLSINIGVTQKSIILAMNWLAQRMIVRPYSVQLENGKVLDGWQTLVYLNTIYNEESLI